MDMDSSRDPVTSGGLALSLVNDPLESGPDLSRWLDATTDLEPRELAEVSFRLREFRSLRAATRGVLEAAVNRAAFPVDAVELLNEVSGRVPRVLVLDPPLVRDEPASTNATARTLA